MSATDSEQIEIAVREHRDLEHLLCRLDDCVEMSDAKKEFLEDICDRVLKYGATVRISFKERTKLNRLKERYLD